MMNERIFNMHTHIFPQKEHLLEDGKRIGVERYLVCSTATTAHQVESINNFVATEVSKHPEFVGFGSLHPDYEEISKEVDRMESLGLKGIKLHPDFQKFNIDDEAAYPIYEAAEGRLPILFHTGDDRYDFSHPTRLLRILDRFPNLTVIAAHLGGYHCWDDAKIYFGHPRVFIDIPKTPPHGRFEMKRLVLANPLQSARATDLRANFGYSPWLLPLFLLVSISCKITFIGSKKYQQNSRR